MVKRHKSRAKKEIFFYKCSITDQKYKVTKKANNPDELISVHAYYDLHPENDDRPEHIKKEELKKFEAFEESQLEMESSADDSTLS